MAGAELSWKSWRFSQSNRKCTEENPGILIIDDFWTLTLVNISKNKTSLWFGCTCRKVNGIFCPFKAWVSKEELEDGVFKFILHRTVGTHNHPSNVAKIIANTMKVKMVALSRTKPDLSAPKIREEVMEDTLKEYKGDQDLLREINMELGDDKTIDKLIQRSRQKQLGKIPKYRDDVDPETFFEATEDDDIIVVSTNNNLRSLISLIKKYTN